MKKYQDAINAAPKSYRIQSFLCDNCNHVHIVFFNKADEVIASGTISDAILESIIDLHVLAAER